jgi:hypothetical protein
VPGQLVLRWLEEYVAFSKANRAPSSIWSPVYTDLNIFYRIQYTGIKVYTDSAVKSSGNFSHEADNGLS